MKKVVLFISALLLLCSCTKKEESIKLSPKQEEILSIVEKDNYIILDVRTAQEFNSSHIKGAINIPHNEINDKIKLDKDKTILVYCQSGGRSSIAADLLTDLGYTVYDMGGIEEVPLDKE